MAIVKSSFCPPLTALASRQRRGPKTRSGGRDEAEPTLTRAAIDTSIAGKPDAAEEPSTPTQLVLPTTTQGSVTTTFTALAAIERIENDAGKENSNKIEQYASMSMSERQEASTITQRFDELETISTASPLAASKKLSLPKKPPLLSEETPTILRQEPIVPPPNIVPPPKVEHEASSRTTSLADTQREPLSSNEDKQEQNEAISNGSGETAIVDLGAIPWVTPLPKVEHESASSRGIQTPLGMVSSSEPPPAVSFSPRRPLNPIPFHHYSTAITTRTKKKKPSLWTATVMVTSAVIMTLGGFIAVRPNVIGALRAPTVATTAPPAEAIETTQAAPPPRVPSSYSPQTDVATPPETGANAETTAKKTVDSAPHAEAVAAGADATSTAAETATPTATAATAASTAETASPSTHGAKTRAERRAKPNSRPRGRPPLPTRRAN